MHLTGRAYRAAVSGSHVVTRNVAASVRARLANIAKESRRPFQELLQYYGLERFLYRFSRTEYCGRFLLKGALMLRVWETPESRPTRDIDLLGFVRNDVGHLEAIVRETCIVDVEDDGLHFDVATVAGERIKENADYEGIRIRFTGLLENARIPMQIDIGFGDIVYPDALEMSYPTILEFPAPHLRMYPRETAVAEKLEAMVFLGTVNSRMKDFYDIWLLARQFEFTGTELAASIAKTFERRRTELDASPVALTATFTSAETAQSQWAAFIRRSNLVNAPATLEEIREPLRQFLLPVVAAITEGRDFTGIWRAGGPWHSES